MARILRHTIRIASAGDRQFWLESPREIEFSEDHLLAVLSLRPRPSFIPQNGLRVRLVQADLIRGMKWICAEKSACQSRDHDRSGTRGDPDYA